jgi:hypothetical protein
MTQFRIIGLFIRLDLIENTKPGNQAPYIEEGHTIRLLKKDKQRSFVDVDISPPHENMATAK